MAKSTANSVKDGQNQLENYASYLKEVKPFLVSGSENEILDVTTLLIKETEAVHLYAKELEEKLLNASNKIENLQNEHSKFREQANRDPLTGALNRAGLKEEFEKIEQQSDIYPISVILADIDNFKQFNDQYGHLVGDNVLKVVSSTLRKNIKGIDLISRFGGEEFLILLLNTQPKDAVLVADKLRMLIEKLRIKHRKTDEYLQQTTISLGISELNDNQSLLEAIDIADKALYNAKERGRNRVVFD